MKLVRARWAAPDLLEALGELAALGAAAGGSAGVAAAWLDRALADLTPARIARRNDALAALRREFFGPGSDSRAAAQIARSLLLYAARARRGAFHSEGRFDLLRQAVVEAGRIPSARTIRKVIAAGCTRLERRQFRNIRFEHATATLKSEHSAQ